MKACLKALCWILLLVLIVGLLNACAGPTPAVEPTEALAAEQETVQTQQVEKVVTLPPPEPTVPVPEKYELRSPDFSGEVSPLKLFELPVFVGQGSLTNDLGQVLEIYVTGSTQESVLQYFATVQMYFEIREPVDLPIVDEEYIELPNLSVNELLKDEKVENLRIDLDLSPATEEKYPQGSVLVIIDPTVRRGLYNNYSTRNPSTDQARMTITVTQGRVTGTLYRQCVAVFGQTKTASVGVPKTLGGSGSGYFDLTIFGVNTGDNKYSLVGTWNYGTGTFVPIEDRPHVTCP